MLFKLQKILDEKAISQNQLAQMCGVKRQFIQRIANEQPPKISLKTVEKLCLALDVQPSDLLECVPD